MTDELELLRAWAPPEAARDEDAAHARVRARLTAHVARAAPAVPARPGPRSRPRRPRARRRWWLVAAPGALAATAAVAVLLSLGSGVQEGSVAPAPATAAEALDQAAAAAERQPAPEAFPRPDQFFYTSSRSTYLSCRIAAGDGFCVLAQMHREAWVGERRRGSETTRVTGHRWPSAAERRTWVAAGRPSLAGLRAGTFALAPHRGYYLGNERLTNARMRAFDQDGAALYRRLRDGVGPSQGSSRLGEVFTQIGDALREQPAPPKLRAALYRALKYVPGVRFVPRTRDGLGRRAVAVTRVEDGTRRELLFDPATSAMLAEREVVVGAAPHRGFSAPLGTVIADAVYERRGVVEEIGEKP
jgi:hypothetical protein